jgi:phosphoadenosine phosphosulfate reductase
MTSQMAAQIREETADLSAQQLLRFVAEQFGDRVALATSLGIEDQVITQMLVEVCTAPNVFTLDTGRLPQETYEVIATTNECYGLCIEMLFPDRRDLEPLLNAQGPELFRHSVEARRACCRARKVLPLRRKLAGLDAWITGLRQEQALTRQNVPRVEWDADNGLIKINPLADWTTEQVWAYARERGVPYNHLHDLGYPSIGCAPCTRAVRDGEDIRAGRWWWEQPEHKECGLHVAHAESGGAT